MFHGLTNIAHLLVKILHKVFELHSQGVTESVRSEISDAVNQVKDVVDKHHNDLAAQDKPSE